MNNVLTVGSIGDAFYVAFTNVLSMFMTFVPQLLSALAVLVIGLVLGKWLGKIAAKLISSIRLSSIVKDSQLESVIKQAQIKLKPEEIVAETIEWLVIIVFFITAINILGLTTVSAFLTSLLSYLPRIFSALLIFLIGVITAGFIENVVKNAIVGVDLATSRLLAKISSYAVMVFAMLIAISELGIAERFIQALFYGLIGTIALALGLSLGLGSKDLVRKILEQWYENVSKKE